jgi:hypothetical protein
VRSEVLNALAALQPLHSDDPEFRAVLETLTGRAFDQLIPHLAALKEAGLLLRRADAYRVVPDLLGALCCPARLAMQYAARPPDTSTGYAAQLAAARWRT